MLLIDTCLIIDTPIDAVAKYTIFAVQFLEFIRLLTVFTQINTISNISYLKIEINLFPNFDVATLIYSMQHIILIRSLSIQMNKHWS